MAATAHLADPPTPRLAYYERDLTALGLLSRKTRYLMRRKRTFPEPVRVGSRILYRAADVHAWLEDPEAWAEAHAVGGGVSA